MLPHGDTVGAHHGDAGDGEVGGAGSECAAALRELHHAVLRVQDDVAHLRAAAASKTDTVRRRRRERLAAGGSPSSGSESDGAAARVRGDCSPPPPPPPRRGDRGPSPPGGSGVCGDVCGGGGAEAGGGAELEETLCALLQAFVRPVFAELCALRAAVALRASTVCGSGGNGAGGAEEDYGGAAAGETMTWGGKEKQGRVGDQPLTTTAVMPHSLGWRPPTFRPTPLETGGSGCDPDSDDDAVADSAAAAGGAAVAEHGRGCSHDSAVAGCGVVWPKVQVTGLRLRHATADVIQSCGAPPPPTTPLPPLPPPLVMKCTAASAAGDSGFGWVGSRSNDAAGGVESAGGAEVVFYSAAPIASESLGQLREQEPNSVDSVG
jgi:hypothetical protein